MRLQIGSKKVMCLLINQASCNRPIMLPPHHDTISAKTERIDVRKLEPMLNRHCLAEQYVS